MRPAVGKYKLGAGHDPDKGNDAADPHIPAGKKRNQGYRNRPQIQKLQPGNPFAGLSAGIFKRVKRNEGGICPFRKKKEYLEPRTLQYRFKKILEQLEIPYFNFHMLRHIFATNCISRGFDMKTLSELLGHSNITTTMRIYVHSDMERKKQLMAGYRLAS